MYSLAPIKRMIYYGQSETATFNPEDPIGFKAFYDNALKDIPYNRLFTRNFKSFKLLKKLNRNRRYL